MKTRIFDDGLEGHTQRSLDRASRREAGERLEPQRILTFADPIDLLQSMTVQRVRLCQTIKHKRLSISALALELGRNRGSVTRDVNKLKEFGLIRLREQANAGHGIVQIVEPIARRIEMRIAI